MKNNKVYLDNNLVIKLFNSPLMEFVSIDSFFSFIELNLLKKENYLNQYKNKLFDDIKRLNKLYGTINVIVCIDNFYFDVIDYDIDDKEIDLKLDFNLSYYYKNENTWYDELDLPIKDNYLIECLNNYQNNEFNNLLIEIK